MSIPRTWVYCDSRGAFGNGGAGHHLHDVLGNRGLDSPPGCPWGWLDGTLCVTGHQRQGEALLRHRDGWTALAFWDRSGDHRPGSHSTFIYHGTLPFETMLEQCERDWPGLFERYKRCGVEIKWIGTITT
jgi:hypothetical protein